MSIDVAAWGREDGKVFLVHNPLLKKWFFANMLVTPERRGPYSDQWYITGQPRHRCLFYRHSHVTKTWDWFPSLESKHHVDLVLGLAMIEKIVAF